MAKATIMSDLGKITLPDEQRGKGVGGHERPGWGQTDIWLTPPDILEPLGTFDLDPCAVAEPRPWQTAKNCISPPDDGLREPWHGRVWLNAPYSRIGIWLGKLVNHGTGTAIAYSRTDTKWFINCVWLRASAILFLHRRRKFCRPDGQKSSNMPGAPVCLIAYGDADAQILREVILDGTFIDLQSEAVAHLGQKVRTQDLFHHVELDAKPDKA